MNLIFITPSFYPSTHYGGPSESVYYLVCEIVKKNKNTFVVTTDANGKENLSIKKNVFIQIADGLNVKYYSNSTSYGFSLNMFLNLYKDIKFSDLIYIVSAFSPSTPLSIYLSMLYKKKIILSPRGQLGEWCLLQGSPLKKLWLKVFINPFINKFIWHATSSQEQEMIRKIFPVSIIWVIPNGISVEQFVANNLNKEKIFFNKYSRNINQFSKVIISMGRIHKKKGFDILINAFYLIKNKYENIFLIIAGEDYGEKEILLKQIKQSNLQDSVFLIGHIVGEEKINFLKNADVFALPSHDENFGLVYAESLASGTPIIASKMTPWSEVEDNKIGKWVDNNASSFANAIEEMLLLNDSTIYKRCKHFITTNYSWQSIAVKMMNKFEEINNG
jgi:glycosyltransferase involved in cell wall biosynthesis